MLHTDTPILDKYPPMNDDLEWGTGRVTSWRWEPLVICDPPLRTMDMVIPMDTQKTLPKRRRNSLRLSGHDYSQPGDYFVTVCTFQRIEWLSSIDHARLHLSREGDVVQRCWETLPRHYSHVQVRAFVAMPNHFHGILTLSERTNNQPRHGLSEIVRWLKGMSTQHLNREYRIAGEHWWQRGFYDEIIRHPRQYAVLHQYVLENPLRWELDRLHPLHPNPFPMDNE
jgi:putative transposase